MKHKELTNMTNWPYGLLSQPPPYLPTYKENINNGINTLKSKLQFHFAATNKQKLPYKK